jgi:predicted nucleotidyltransferase
MNNKEKLLQQLMDNPNKEFHIRLLARLTKLNPNTIISITDELAEEGIAIKEKSKERNVVIIKANVTNNKYRLQKQFYKIQKLHKSGLIDHLNGVFFHPTIILFGSYAKAENIPGSDIDLFIITEDKKRNADIKKYEDILNAPMQLFVHTRKEFDKLKKTNPELINNVINGYRLTGYLEVF